MTLGDESAAAKGAIVKGTAPGSATVKCAAVKGAAAYGAAVPPWHILTVLRVMLQHSMQTSLTPPPSSLSYPCPAPHPEARL